MVSSQNTVVLHIRELTPKDLYYAQLLRNQEKHMLLLIERLILNPEVLDIIKSTQFIKIVEWVLSDILDSKVLTVENWLELAFHLCKQRWDNSVDWLETQPMSKIFLMLDIVKKHNEQQEEAMKKASRKKK